MLAEILFVLIMAAAVCAYFIKRSKKLKALDEDR
jgi:hypothetical protein